MGTGTVYPTLKKLQSYSHEKVTCRNFVHNVISWKIVKYSSFTVLKSVKNSGENLFGEVFIKRPISTFYKL
jgi:hypothetical protein